MSDILMPRLSDSMEEGTIVKWIASEGDEVSEGDELVEIETDKANMVYEADESGTLTEIVAQEGDTVALGEPIARFGEGGGGASSGSEEESEDDSEDEEADADVEADAGEDAGGEDEETGDEEPEPHDDEAREENEEEGGAEEAAPEAKEAEQQPEDEESERGGTEEGDDPSSGSSDEDSSSSSSSDDASGPRVKASPLARRIASESGVDLQNVQGSGPGGRILRADVEAAASGGSSATDEAPAEKPKSEKKAKKSKKDKKAKKDEGAKDEGAKAAPERGETAKGTTETVELTRLQQTVARRMSESKATAPHFYLQSEIDMSRAVEARAALKASAREGDPVPSFNDMVVKACAVALAEFPRANGAYKDGRFELYSRINVGIAVAGQDALVVPTIFDCDKKGLREIATDARALAGKVRDRSITPPELSGATFTVSNLGMYGVTNFHAVINSPQAAILAVGAITEKPVIRDGELETAHLMGVTLACDHRILYGADGAEFLARVRALLEEPVGLAL